MRLFNLDDVFRSAHRDDLATADTAFRAQIDNPVGQLDHIEIVLDQHQSVTLLQQAVEHFRQLADVLEVQARSGLVHHVHLSA